MKKKLLKERLQELAGIKPLYQIEQFDPERRRDREAPRKPRDPRDPRDLRDPRNPVEPTKDMEAPTKDVGTNPSTPTPMTMCSQNNALADCHQFQECVGNSFGPTTNFQAGNPFANGDELWLALNQPSPGQVKKDNFGNKYKYIGTGDGQFVACQLPTTSIFSCCGVAGCMDQSATNYNSLATCGCTGNGGGTNCCIYNECWDVRYVQCDSSQIPGQQFEQMECISSIGGNPPDLSTNNTFRTGTGTPTTVMIGTQEFTNQSGYIDYKIVDINPQSNPVAGADHDIGMC